MSNILVKEVSQPSAEAFAALPTADELAAMTATPALAPVVDEPAAEGNAVPDKFAGKSAADIAESYANLEAELGRKAQEVGSLRSLTDQLLELKRTEDLQNNGVQPASTEVTADDLLADPRSTIASVAGEVTDAATQRVEQLEARLALQDFEGRHPTFRNDQSDPAFQQFVQGSSYRSGLASKAAAGDLTAAEELWNGYADVRGSGTTSTEKPTTADEAEALAQATAVATRGGGETDLAPAPIFSRQAVIEKRINDEAGYNDPAFQAMLKTAYLEGRVK